MEGEQGANEEEVRCSYRTGSGRDLMAIMARNQREKIAHETAVDWFGDGDEDNVRQVRSTGQREYAHVGCPSSTGPV